MHFTVADAVQHGIRLMKGLSALHRLDVAHRDIKPATFTSGATAACAFSTSASRSVCPKTKSTAAALAHRATWRRNSFRR
jgi:hypothetical protein